MANLNNLGFRKEASQTIETLDELMSSDIYTGFEEREIERGLSLTDSGKIVIDGDELPITQNGLTGLCKSLRIPNPFIRNIPFDLLQENIARLSVVKELKAYIKDDYIANIAPTKAWGLNIRTFISKVTELMPDLAPHFIGISESRVTIDLTTPALDVVKAKEVGDITKFGWKFNLSEIGWNPGLARFLAYRLVCKNGMVAPKSWACIKAKQRGDADSQVQTFIRRVAKAEEDYSVFKVNYAKVANGEKFPTNKQYYTLWNGLRKLFGDPDLADSILGVDKETRNVIRQRGKNEGDLFFEGDIPDVHEDWWSVINKITYSAKDMYDHGNAMTLPSRDKLQELGGKALMLAIRS